MFTLGLSPKNFNNTINICTEQILMGKKGQLSISKIRPQTGLDIRIGFK